MSASSRELVDLAADVADRAHAGQVDKGGVPYVEHCQRVAARLDTPVAQTVALLHDVLEDTGTPEAELRSTFGDEVVDAVVALTRVKGEPDERYYARVRGNELALQVKLADIDDNLDPARLALLDGPTVDHLLAKYDKARASLSSP